MLSHPNAHKATPHSQEQCLLLHKQVNGCQVAECVLDEDKEDPTEPVGEDCSNLRTTELLTICSILYIVLAIHGPH